MNLVNLSLADDFSRTPGPRLRRQGAHSAEEFFEEHLLPGYEEALERDAQLLLDLDGTAGVAASFLDEVCERLVNRFGAGDVADRIMIVSEEEPHLEQEMMSRICAARA